MHFYLHCLIILCFICATLNLCHGKTIKKAEAKLVKPPDELAPFQGKSFPYEPEVPEELQRMLSNQLTTSKNSWQGKWFPYAPGEPHIPKQETDQRSTKFKDSWQGKWFPFAPGQPHIYQQQQEERKESKKQHKISICDDGVNNLSVDYDPQDIRYNYNYLCLQSNRSLFNPNLNTEALLTSHFLPSAYVPPAKCMNESIGYSHEPPTNGAFRPLPAVYGSYKYLPPQRYMRNLAEGAIIMLYHPCAYWKQVKQLQDIVQGCLYRHIITPSQLLTPERPLAVLSWRNSLSMSVVDEKQVGRFIQKYAKQGPLSLPNLSRVVENRKSYKAALLTEARLVTDLDDSELCGYLMEHM